MTQSILLSYLPLLIYTLLAQNANSLAPQKPITRTTFFQQGIASAAALAVTTASSPAQAIAPKRKNISDEELQKIIKSDLVDRQFLASADITREVYDESSIFTDEIDKYPIEKWIKGTKKLFVAEGSHVDLIGDVVVTPTEVNFRFDEDLMFNIPFKPVVHLSGKVVLTRDTETGLITSYREFWDQDVNSVLKTAKFKI